MVALLTVAAGAAAPLILDPARHKPGSRVGSFTIRTIDATAVEGQGWIGHAELAGEVELIGTIGPHPADPELGVRCFFADRSSSARLPRFANDGREAWFCLDSDPSLKDGPASIVISDYHYVYAHSDVNNSATLRRVVRQR